MQQTRFNFDFMRYRATATAVSALLVLLSVGSLAVRQLNWGLDFTGGTLVEVEYRGAVVPDAIRDELEQAGFEGHVVQHFGAETDVLIRMPPQPDLDEQTNARLGDQVVAALQQTAGDGVTLRRSEYVGPAVGAELTEQGGIGMLVALGCVLLYVAFRFQYKFAVGAVAALFHDVLITLGVFSVIGWSFDQTVLAALLALIGYSLNDTIVVSDRIRENFRKLRKATPVETINLSLNQTLARTLITSLTTLLVLLALLLLGGELIRGFAVGLIIGVLVGTYSSIYVAANILLLLGVQQQDLAIPLKEGSEQDDLGLG